ncbi:MAG TPA: TolC family protein [Elusimicrobiales bacterium]|nr:TolC family protein [Elusimicrobiales bacterium]
MKLILLFLILSTTAQAGEFSVTLKTAEDAALAASGQYRAALAAAEAAQSAAAAAAAPLGPRVALEGSLRYNEVVTEMKLGALTRPLGDNWNYSLGPSAYYTLYDGGALRGAYEAGRRNALARKAEAEQARRQALLKARTAYFNMQLALEKVYLIGENLQLALSQLKDMELGVKAGTRSRLDGIRARQEATARRRDLLRARRDLAAALRELTYAAGLEFKGDISLPLDARMAGRDYGGAAAGVYIKADSYGDILARLLPAAEKPADPALPAAAALENSAEAYRYSAKAYGAERLPRLNLGARSSLDYPNGPNLYSFLQNSASLSLSLPLFESGRSGEKRKESELNAKTALERRADILRAARRDFDAARDAYAALLAEQALNIEAADDADDAARLAYDAYQAGGGTWLEVESANLKVLQARTTAAMTNSEILVRLAQLDSLSAN